jgi:hypothetical protein
LETPAEFRKITDVSKKEEGPEVYDVIIIGGGFYLRLELVYLMIYADMASSPDDGWLQAGSEFGIFERMRPDSGEL